MKYSISESPELSVAETQNIEPLTISKIESDSLEVNTIDYSVSNPD